MGRPSWKVGTAALVALALGVGGWWVALRPDDEPPPAAQSAAADTGMSPSLAPFTVSLGATPDRAELDFGTRVGFTADVVSPTPVHRVELWDGSTLVAANVTSDPAGATSLHAQFAWTAVSPGRHLLAARAVATDGTRSWSRSIGVTVGLSREAATGGAVLVPAEAGQTAAATAAQLGVDPASLVLPDSGGTTAADTPDAPVGPAVAVLPPPVEGGDDPEVVQVEGIGTTTTATTTTTTVPDTTTTTSTVPDTTTTTTITSTPVTTTTTPVTTTTTPVTTTTTPVTTTTAPPDDTPLLVGGLVVMQPVQYLGLFPAPADDPIVTITADGCDVRLSRTEPLDSVLYLHRSDAARPWFVNRGGVAKGVAEFVDTQLMPGIYTYVAASEDDQQQSAPVMVVIPSSCGDQSGWTGDFRIVNGVLTVPAPGNGYFVYLGPAGTAKGTINWSRIPEDDRAVINAKSTAVEITHLLPNFYNITSWTAELWRTDGVDAVKVGDAQLTVPAGLTVDDVVGWGLTFDLTTTGGDRSVVLQKNTNQQFAWEADYGVNRVVWQVLAKPLPRTNTSLTPPGLLAVGVSETPAPHHGFGYFSFDTGKIPRTAPPEPAGSSSGGSGSGPGLGAALGTTPVQPPSLPTDDGAVNYATAYDDDFVLDPNPASPLGIEEMFGSVDTAAGVAVYVRGIPMIGSQVTGIASPSVALVMPDQPGVGDLSFQSVTLDSGRVPNPAWQRCAVVDVPWDDPSWVAPADVPPGELSALQSVYYSDGEYCRQDPPPQDMSWDEELWAVLEASGQQFVGFYDAAASAYNSLVAYAAQAVADWNPICEALGGSAAQSCRDATKAMAAVAIKAALSFLGLPPALPTSSQLIASARAAMEADLSLFAVEWMQSMGIPCEEYAQDPSTYADAQLAASKLGVSLDDPLVGEDGQVNLCRELARALFDEFVEAAQASFNSQVSTAMGGPAQSGPIPGFEISAHPAGRWNPMVVTVVAVASTPGLDPSFVCTATIKNFWNMRHDYGTAVTLRHQPDGTWQGTALINTLPDTASDVATLYSDLAYFGPTPTFAPEVSVGNDGCFGDQKTNASDVLEPAFPDP